jgi:formylglycine-generating enzyme required for sulfatase activity
MKMQIPILLAALALAAAPAHAQLAVGNVRAAQRASTKLVDIDYDLTGIATPVTVSLEISSDGGTTWSVPATTLIGAVGSSVTPGTNLRITWDAGADWNNQTSAQTRFRIKVSDGLPPDLAVFSLIPTGNFTMGDSLDGLSDATPHTVNVSAFYMQKNGVTKADWDVVRIWGLTNGYDLSAGAGKGANHPVQMVSWHDVVKWCNARSEKEGLTPCYYTDAAQTLVFKTGTNDIGNTMVKWRAKGYRLPTEAEWEKAARGGLTGLRFPWGNTISHANANFNNVGGESYQTGTTGYHPIWATGSVPYTSAVEAFPANGYGIRDMAGNVWEWCWDWYDDAYYGASPATDPQGPASGSNRVKHGGTWIDDAYFSRVAYRYSTSPGLTRNFNGFRPVRANLVTADSSDIDVMTKNPILTIIAPHGTTDPAAGQYPYLPGDIVTLTALNPAPGYYLFSKWTDDATGNANPLSVTMDRDKTITAVFAPDSRDPDGDGLTNYEELVTYGTLPNVADTDGDGFSDGYEVHHGTLPKDKDSRPDAMLQIFTAVELRLDTVLGQNYRIESSTDMIIWRPVDEHIVGTGGTVTLFYSIQEIPKRYFKVVRE